MPETTEDDGSGNRHESISLTPAVAGYRWLLFIEQRLAGPFFAGLAK